jgi:hypothetical protein
MLIDHSEQGLSQLSGTALFQPAGIDAVAALVEDDVRTAASCLHVDAHEACRSCHRPTRRELLPARSNPGQSVGANRCAGHIQVSFGGCAQPYAFVSAVPTCHTGDPGYANVLVSVRRFLAC